MTRISTLTKLSATATAATLLLLFGCSSDDSDGASDGNGMAGMAGMPADGEEPSLDIVETAAAAGTFSTLASLLDETGLTAALKGAGPFTVFAPSDQAFEAFEAANPGVLESLTTEQAGEVLKYHVVSGSVAAADLVSGSLVVTLNGLPFAVDLEGGAKVGGVNVVSTDIEATNGIIHVVDSVIVPPSENIVETAVAAGSFTTLAGALVATGLADTLTGEGPFTVFAPTDDAFAAFEAANPGVLGGLSTEALSEVLLYHVVPGWAGPADLADGAMVPTALSGASVTVSLDSGVQIDGANVDQLPTS
jgi:transforming growth factor-beta-induced protein